MDNGSKVVAFGEIMLRLSPPGYQRFVQARAFDVTFGGGEANVMASLAGFGVEAEFVTRLPANELGDACLAFLRSHSIRTDHILRGGSRLGVDFLETGAAQRASKVVYDRADSAFATIQPGMVDWDAVLAAAAPGADWFHWTGITPAVSGSAAAACLEAVQAARRLGVTVSCDLNYRKNLWRWGKAAGEVMPELVAYADVVIANEEDAEKVFGIRASGADSTAVGTAVTTGGELAPESYRSVAENLAARFPRLRTIAITLRRSHSASHNTWSAVLWHEGEWFVGPQYEILPVVDRVGGGDAFAAGIIYGLRLRPGDPSYALRYATAASCLKHSIPGDFNAVTRAEVEQLMAGDASGRISR